MAALVVLQIVVGLVLVRAEFGLWNWANMPASEVKGSPDAQAFISQLSWQSIVSLALTLALLVLAAGFVFRGRRRSYDPISRTVAWLGVFVSLSVLLIAAGFRAHTW